MGLEAGQCHGSANRVHLSAAGGMMLEGQLFAHDSACCQACGSTQSHLGAPPAGQDHHQQHPLEGPRAVGARCDHMGRHLCRLLVAVEVSGMRRVAQWGVQPSAGPFMLWCLHGHACCTACLPLDCSTMLHLPQNLPCLAHTPCPRYNKEALRLRIFHLLNQPAGAESHTVLLQVGTNT